MQIRVIEIIGPIGLVFCVINTLMIMMIKSLNEPPSDILLFISLQTALKIVLYFATISTASITQSIMEFIPSQPPLLIISMIFA